MYVLCLHLFGTDLVYFFQSSYIELPKRIHRAIHCEGRKLYLYIHPGYCIIVCSIDYAFHLVCLLWPSICVLALVATSHWVGILYMFNNFQVILNNDFTQMSVTSNAAVGCMAICVLWYCILWFKDSKMNFEINAELEINFFNWYFCWIHLRFIVTISYFRSLSAPQSDSKPCF